MFRLIAFTLATPSCEPGFIEYIRFSASTETKNAVEIDRLNIIVKLTNIKDEFFTVHKELKEPLTIAYLSGEKIMIHTTDCTSSFREFREFMMVSYRQ